LGKTVRRRDFITLAIDAVGASAFGRAVSNRCEVEKILIADPARDQALGNGS
jgi:hypothetical protein